jgi:hypothetical protein
VEAIGIGVAITVISAAILAGARWLASEDNREAAKQYVRERFCRHEWEPINKPGERIVVITGDREWCVKCGARR